MSSQIPWDYGSDQEYTRLQQQSVRIEEKMPFDKSKKYCVIANVVTQKIPRTWVGDADEAVRHATNLLKQNQRNDPGMELLVVEVKQIVRLVAPPIEIENVD